MSLTAILVSTLGKPVADRLVQVLTSKKGGAQKFEQATAAMTQGLTAIDAMKKAFGKDFLLALNAVLGSSGTSKFSYEAGTQAYIRLDANPAAPVKVLRDELNLNLDRLTVLDMQSVDLKNHFRGLVFKWQERCQQLLDARYAADVKSTISAIDDLLQGESRNFRQIYQLLSSTSLGGVGTLMAIAGVFTATGTGVGVVSSISLYLFGIPWMAVGVLVLPGALLVVLAAKKSKPTDEMSLSIAMAYKMLERIDKNAR